MRRCPPWRLLPVLCLAALAGRAPTRAGEAPLEVPGIPTAYTSPNAPRRDSQVKRAVADFRDRYGQLANPPRPLDEVTRVGEKLTYQIRWNKLPVGKSTLRVKRCVPLRGRRAFTFEMRTESNDFLSVIYPVDDTIKSFADVETGQSYLFRRRVREGRYQADDRLEFDYGNVNEEGNPAPVSLYSKYVRGSAPKRKTPLPIPGSLQDSLSILYYLRNFPFDKIGQEHQFLLGTRKRTDIVSVKAVREETLELKDLGSFRCIVVKPDGETTRGNDNLFVTEGEALIWFEKSTNIPLQVEVDIPIGRVTATLTGAGGVSIPGLATAGANP